MRLGMTHHTDETGRLRVVTSRLWTEQCVHGTSDRAVRAKGAEGAEDGRVWQIPGALLPAGEH